MSRQKCRVCGCTDQNCRQCLERIGEPCHWVEPDLCSACTGLTAISLERIRHATLGFGEAHDRQHRRSQLTDAAACYLLAAGFQVKFPGQVNFKEVPKTWPWHPNWWKPSEDPKRNLEKAGALIAAEYDRLTAEDAVVPTLFLPNRRKPTE